VRFIGNHSSGKWVLILLLVPNLGASVILVSGPTHCKVNNPLIKVIPVVSAQETYNACHSHYADADVALPARCRIINLKM
jgi:phosphopantothenoylcysteine decarboxylase/phosphopantothenate--cysteine ligase